MLTSTLVIAAHTAGHAFTRSLVTPLMVSAEVNVVIFALALRLTVMIWGLLEASAAAYLVSPGSAALTVYFLRRQHA